MDRARQAAEFSYSPYSRYRVGAAVLCRNGSIYSGCNVENESITETVCAERTAIVKAVSEGNQEIIAVAVYVTGQVNVWPCGVCLQFVAEFGQNIEIVTEQEDGSLSAIKVCKLLPALSLQPRGS